MHPSVCVERRIHLPLQGRLWEAAWKAPLQGELSASADGGVRHLALPIPFRVASILPNLAVRRLHKTTASPLRKPPRRA